MGEGVAGRLLRVAQPAGLGDPALVDQLAHQAGLAVVLHAAQVLLTHADLADRERYLNARSTLLTLLSHQVVPVINENDTVVTDEIKFGDNDTLGALVANLVEADALVILTDQKGLYSADPRKDPGARFIDVCTAGDPALEQMAGGAGSRVGTGGMITKVLAAKRAAGSGASTVIAWGREPDVLVRLTQGEAIGSLFVADTAKLTARKQWMADHLQLRGAVVVDEGALDLLGGLPTLGDLHAVGDAAHVDLGGRRALAGVEVGGGKNDIELAVHLDDVALAERGGDDFHGRLLQR